MRLLLCLILGALLLLVCWPLALLVALAFPFVWLISIPLRIAAAALEGLIALLRELFFLPARVLGFRERP